LCDERVAQSIFESAAIYDRQQNWYLVLLLLMPDHLHALVSIGGETSLSKVIGNFKRTTGKFAEVQWQRNFFDHRLRGDEDPLGKSAYIRQNPVRAGLVASADDWPYVLDRSALEKMAVR
jgi:putative transposase